jgi:hypothetical protein
VATCQVATYRKDSLSECHKPDAAFSLLYVNLQIIDMSVQSIHRYVRLSISACLHSKHLDKLWTDSGEVLILEGSAKESSVLIFIYIYIYIGQY